LLQKNFTINITYDIEIDKKCIALDSNISSLNICKKLHKNLKYFLCLHIFYSVFFAKILRKKIQLAITSEPLVVES